MESLPRSRQRQRGGQRQPREQLVLGHRGAGDTRPDADWMV